MATGTDSAAEPAGPGGDRAAEARLEAFRQTQALAYEACLTVEERLVEGWTERRAARELGRVLRERGVREWFHQPFVWFGDRTAFRARHGSWTPLHFFPTGRRLEPQMPVILDVAPVVDGAAADVGYACSFGEEANPLHEQLVADLAGYRDLVLEQVRAGRTLRAIYRAVDERLADQGYRSAHRTYPFSVIAHRVADHQPAVPRAVRGARVGGFGLGAQRWLLANVAGSMRGRVPSPLWNDSRFADHPATPGLWAVEPHLALRGTGVKFEELLVVTDDDAFWLDDDLPHVRRWRADAATAVAA